MSVVRDETTRRGNSTVHNPLFSGVMAGGGRRYGSRVEADCKAQAYQSCPKPIWQVPLSPWVNIRKALRVPNRARGHHVHFLTTDRHQANGSAASVRGRGQLRLVHTKLGNRILTVVARGAVGNSGGSTGGIEPAGNDLCRTPWSRYRSWLLVCASFISATAAEAS